MTAAPKEVPAAPKEVPVAHRDVMPHADPKCRQCKGTGEYVHLLPVARQEDYLGPEQRARLEELKAMALPKPKKNRKRKPQWERKARLCSCALRRFVQAQRCRVLATGALIAVEPFTGLTPETMALVPPDSEQVESAGDVGGEIPSGEGVPRGD